jgi:3-oxoacyl-[acyl-carrier-protein] synthase-1
VSGASLKQPADDAAWQPLAVHAAGLCCAVGYSLAAASCAIRAGMDHFQESPFIDNSGKTLLAAKLDLDDIWGPQRLAEMVSMAVRDCESGAEKIDPGSTVLIGIGAERGRPHTGEAQLKHVYRACEAQFQGTFHAASTLFPHGRAGIGDALWHAQASLRLPGVRRALLVGADSLLDAATIGYYLRQERILCSTNACGFIPGEGAGVILLGPARRAQPGLHITGVGRALEQARPDGQLPNRAMGLTAAIREACKQAHIDPTALDCCMNDQNGEPFFAIETANAHARVMRERDAILPLLQLADCTGETGGAAAAISLAYLTSLMERTDSPGQRALLHFASDDGKRAAFILDSQALC